MRSFTSRGASVVYAAGAPDWSPPLPFTRVWHCAQMFTSRSGVRRLGLTMERPLPARYQCSEPGPWQDSQEMFIASARPSPS